MNGKLKYLLIFTAFVISSHAEAYAPKAVRIVMPKPGPLSVLVWTPKPQVVFMDVPLQKRALYERIGPKLYRRVK